MRVKKIGSRGQTINRGRQVQIILNDKPVFTYEGELVSTVLQSEGIHIFNRKHKTGKPAGIYCGMGICYECLVNVNGVANTRACQSPIEEGMTIHTELEGKS